MPIIFVLLIMFYSLSVSFYPEVSSILGSVSLLLSLVLFTYFIIRKHKGTENARPKIFKEVGLTVLTLVIVLFLGGIAAMLVNYKVSMKWGEVAGLVSAIGASFMVGYLVRKGMMRFTD